MPLNTFVNLYGQTINDLLVIGIHGRDYQNLPIWVCKCLLCNTTGILIPHLKFQHGNARCPSSICGKASKESKSAGSTGTRIPAYRTASVRSRKEFEESFKGTESYTAEVREQILAEANRIYAWLHKHD